MTEIIDGIPQPINVGDKYVKATWFETVGSGTTSGTITKPAGAGDDSIFVMDEWGTDTDALVSTMDNGKPTFENVVDSGGSTITTTFNLAGEYAFSGTPSPAGEHAVIFVYKCFLKNFNADESIFESEIVPATPGSDHNIASHNDTTATGAELETLTDGSDAADIHIHDARYYTETELDAGQLDDIKHSLATAAGDVLIASGSGVFAKQTRQAGINTLTAVSGATNEHVLTKDTGTGNAIFKVGASVLSGFTDTGADYNTALGHQALDSLTGGSGLYNTAVGFDAGTAVTIGDSNVMVGYQAGIALTEGTGNVFLGNEAGSALTTTTACVCIGNAAGIYCNATGNTMVGDNAGRYSTSGIQNTVIGKSAGQGVFETSTYANSVLVGYQAGFALTTGDDNVLIGGLSGNTITTGNSNTTVGYDADVDSASAVNRTALGHDAVATADNQIMLGDSNVTEVKTVGVFATVAGFNCGDAGGFSGIKFNAGGTTLEFWIDGAAVARINAGGDYEDLSP